MKLRDDFIYFTGVCHETDTCFTFMNVLRQQESVEGFPGEALPSTAFYFTKQGVTDWASLLSYGDMQETGVRTSDVRNRNRELSHYLMENAGQELVACLFQVSFIGSITKSYQGCFSPFFGRNGVDKRAQHPFRFRHVRHRQAQNRRRFPQRIFTLEKTGNQLILPLQKRPPRRKVRRLPLFMPIWKV